MILHNDILFVIYHQLDQTLFQLEHIHQNLNLMFFQSILVFYRDLFLEYNFLLLYNIYYSGIILSRMTALNLSLG